MKGKGRILGYIRLQCKYECVLFVVFAPAQELRTFASGSAPARCGACAAVHKPLGAAGPQWRGAGGAHAIAKAHAACIHEGGFGPTWAEGGWRSGSHGVVAAAAAAVG